MGNNMETEAKMSEQEKLGVWKPIGGEGITQHASDEDDVEGHANTWRAPTERASSERASTPRVADDDEDLEGHKNKA